MKKLLLLLALLIPTLLKAQNTVTLESGTVPITPSPSFRYKAITPDSLNHLWIYNPLTGKYNRLYTATEANKNALSKQIDSLNTTGIIPNSNYSGVWIGDSQSTGTGIPYTSDASYIVPRSLYNTSDKGFPNNRTFIYPTTTNMALALTTGSGITSTGSLIGSGMTLSRLQLTAGQTITITNRQLRYVDFIYNGTNSSGTLTIAVNGGNVRTITLSGSGLQNSFTGTTIANQQQTAMTDVITVTASANAEIVGVQTLREAHVSPNIYMSARTATNFQDYNNAASYGEIAFELNSIGLSTAQKYHFIALGTNGIYAATKAQIPSVYIASLDSLIKGVKALATNVTPILFVPPRANETLYPVIKAGYTYQDYVNALTAYSQLTGYPLVRTDLTPLGKANAAYLNADGLHLNATGQQLWAATACRLLGVPLDGTLTENTINSVDAKLFFPQTSNISNSLVLRDANGAFDAGAINATRSSFNDGTQGFIIGAYTGGAGAGALSVYGITPSITNYKVLANSTDTYVNGGTTHIQVGASDIITVTPAGATTTTQAPGDNSTKLATTAYVDASGAATSSGTYTPSLTNNTNIASSSVQGVATYMRIGNVVHVSMGVNVTPTVSASNTILYFTLPSGFNSSATSMWGLANGFGVTNTTCGVSYQSATQGKMTFVPPAGSSTYYVQFDYSL